MIEKLQTKRGSMVAKKKLVCLAVAAINRRNFVAINVSEIIGPYFWEVYDGLRRFFVSKNTGASTQHFSASYSCCKEKGLKVFQATESRVGLLLWGPFYIEMDRGVSIMDCDGVQAEQEKKTEK